MTGSDGGAETSHGGESATSGHAASSAATVCKTLIEEYMNLTECQADNLEEGVSKSCRKLEELLEKNACEHADVSHEGGHEGGHESPTVMLFIFSCCILGALIRTLLKKVPLPYTVVLLFFGVVIGVIARHVEALTVYTNIAHMDPHLIFHVFLPVLIFESAFSLDVHTFSKVLMQVLILALPGLLLASVLTAILSIFIFDYKWTWTIGMMFGSIVSATDPVAVVALLKDLGASKTLAILIEGESLLNDGAAIVIYHVLSDIIEHGDESELSSADGIVVYFLKVAIGGPAFGFMMGKMTTFWLSMIFNDALTEITITLGSAYVTFYVGEVILGVSGVLAVVMLGVVMSAEKTSISPEVEIFLHRFWEMLAYLANTLIFMLVGIVIARRVGDDVEAMDWFYFIVCYIGVNIIRGIVIGCFGPILANLGYGFTWQNGVVITWAGLRGAVGLTLALLLFKIKTLDKKMVSSKILFHTAGIVIMTLFINATTIKWLLKKLGMSEISTPKRMAMQTAVRYLVDCKSKAISILKSDRFLADADWELVERSCIITDPYHTVEDELLLEEEKTFYQRVSVCPECETLVSNEPSPQEQREMENEARLRFIKAQKGSSEDGEGGLSRSDEGEKDTDDSPPHNSQSTPDSKELVSGIKPEKDRKKKPRAERRTEKGSSSPKSQNGESEKSKSRKSKRNDKKLTEAENESTRESRKSKKSKKEEYLDMEQELEMIAAEEEALAKQIKRLTPTKRTTGTYDALLENVTEEDQSESGLDEKPRLKVPKKVERSSSPCSGGSSQTRSREGDIHLTSSSRKTEKTKKKRSLEDDPETEAIKEKLKIKVTDTLADMFREDGIADDEKSSEEEANVYAEKTGVSTKTSKVPVTKAKSDYKDWEVTAWKSSKTNYRPYNRNKSNENSSSTSSTHEADENTSDDNNAQQVGDKETLVENDPLATGTISGLANSGFSVEADTETSAGVADKRKRSSTLTDTATDTPSDKIIPTTVTSSNQTEFDEFWDGTIIDNIPIEWNNNAQKQLIDSQENLNQSRRRSDDYEAIAEESRKRYLNACKVSYWKQFEHGMLSREAVSKLVECADIATDQSGGYMDLTEIKKTWQVKGVFPYLKQKLETWGPNRKGTQVEEPKSAFRRTCFKMANHMAFEWIINIVICINMFPIVIELNVSPGQLDEMKEVLDTSNYVFFGIYCIEAFVKIAGLGVHYFLSHWNQLDILIIILSVVDIVIDSVKTGKTTFAIDPSFLKLARIFRLLRISRLLKLCRPLIPKILGFFNTQINKQLSFGYDVGKGYVSGEEEVNKLIDQMIDHKPIAMKLREISEQGRLEVIRELAMLQREHPGIAVAVKTRQAIRSVLNTIMESLNDLKGDGLLDDMESLKLAQMVELQMKKLLNAPSSIPPPPPENMLSYVSWLEGDQQLINLIKDRAKLISFNYGDVIMHIGDKINGIYIIVSGLVRLEGMSGHSPVLKAILSRVSIESDPNANVTFMDFLTAGKVIGEMSLLTNEPRNAKVTCETAVQCYFIHIDDCMLALQMFQDEPSLEKRLWMTVAKRISASLLNSDKNYSAWSKAKVKMHLQNAYVPNLEDISIFNIDSTIRDVFLIQGQATELPNKFDLNGPIMVSKGSTKIILHHQDKPKLVMLVVPCEGLGQAMTTTQLGKKTESKSSLASSIYEAKGRRQSDARNDSKRRISALDEERSKRGKTNR